MTKRWATALAAAACVTLIPTVTAGAESTRPEYKAQVEPICERNATASEDILAGTRARIRRGNLAPAGRQFTRAAVALRRALAELRRVPPPAADAERLSKWLDRVARQADLLQETGRALIAGNRRRAGTLVTKLSTSARMANALVVVFEFRHCRFEPSRYT